MLTLYLDYDYLCFFGLDWFFVLRMDLFYFIHSVVFLFYIIINSIKLKKYKITLCVWYKFDSKRQNKTKIVIILPKIKSGLQYNKSRKSSAFLKNKSNQKNSGVIAVIFL